MQPADQSVIFERFRQVGDTLVGKPPGTGLGLADLPQIVEHLGGRMWVESEEGARRALLVYPAGRPGTEPRGRRRHGDSIWRNAAAAGPKYAGR